jgi:hypothetical protein
MALTYQEWLNTGIKHGYISEPGCYFHSVIPLSDDERKQVDETGEPDNCVTIVRLYPQLNSQVVDV